MQSTLLNTVAYSKCSLNVSDDDEYRLRELVFSM